MKRFVIGAALAVAAYFGAFALASPAYSQPAARYSALADDQTADLAAREQANYLADRAQLTAEPTTVTVVQPDAINEVSQTLPSLIAAAVFGLLLRFAGPFAWALKVARADQMIERYTKGIIDEWLDHHPDWRTQGITVDVKKQWLAQIATSVINYAPGWLIQFLGGKEAIIQKIRNRLPDVIKNAFPALFDAHYSVDGVGVIAAPAPLSPPTPPMPPTPPKS